MKPTQETLKAWEDKHRSLQLGCGPITELFYHIGSGDNPHLAWLAVVLFSKGKHKGQFDAFNETMLVNVRAHVKSHMGFMRVLNRYFKKIAMKGVTYRVLSTYKRYEKSYKRRRRT